MQIGEVPLPPTCNAWAAFLLWLTSSSPAASYSACSATLSSELDKRDCLSCSLKRIYSPVIFHDTIVLLSEAMDHCRFSSLCIWQRHSFPVKINPPWLSWLCFLYCSSILWDPAALCTLPHPCRDASGTTTSVQLWMLWEQGGKRDKIMNKSFRPLFKTRLA